jgi:hypothetical protein
MMAQFEMKIAWFFNCFLYETLAKALQTEAFHCSLWPEQISCSGRAGLYETLTEAL